MSIYGWDILHLFGNGNRESPASANKKAERDIQDLFTQLDDICKESKTSWSILKLNSIFSSTIGSISKLQENEDLIHLNSLFKGELKKKRFCQLTGYRELTMFVQINLKRCQKADFDSLHCHFSKSCFFNVLDQHSKWITKLYECIVIYQNYCIEEKLLLNDANEKYDEKTKKRLLDIFNIHNKLETYAKTILTFLGDTKLIDSDDLNGISMHIEKGILDATLFDCVPKYIRRETYKDFNIFRIEKKKVIIRDDRPKPS